MSTCSHKITLFTFLLYTLSCLIPLPSSQNKGEHAIHRRLWISLTHCLSNPSRLLKKRNVLPWDSSQFGPLSVITYLEQCITLTSALYNPVHFACKISRFWISILFYLPVTGFFVFLFFKSSTSIKPLRRAITFSSDYCHSPALCLFQLSHRCLHILANVCFIRLLGTEIKPARWYFFFFLKTICCICLMSFFYF